MNNKRLMSEINVVPYIDVMLVLLIIFMLTAPVINKSIDISLPKTGDSSTYSEVTSDDIIVYIKSDGKLVLNDNVVNLEEISLDKTKIINIAADKSMPYGDVIKILSEFKDYGYLNVSLVIEIQNNP